jgi:gluconate 5-dehydrogenase
MTEPFSLRGETALITGGGTGLGLGIARCFVEAGARVILTGRREEVLREACAGLGEAARYEVCDITAAGAAAALAARCGEVSVLVNNAGIHLKKDAVETTLEEFKAVLDTHVNAAFSLTTALAPGMMQRGHGSILFMASMTTFLGMPKVIAYSTAKAAYVGMVRGFTAEFAARGVRVNAIAPGWIATPMTEKALGSDPPRKAKVLGRTPMGRLGEPEDIGWAAVYLSSPAARFVTGAILAVDGGALYGF